jgi:hypothetical protein
VGCRPARRACHRRHLELRRHEHQRRLHLLIPNTVALGRRWRSLRVRVASRAS